MIRSMQPIRWGVWFISEWQSRRLGSVPAVDALFALEVARVKFASMLFREREAAPGGTLAAVRVGLPDPVARLAARGEFFAPKIRYAPKGKNGGARAAARSDAARAGSVRASRS
jgi:hypothetical protein